MNPTSNEPEDTTSYGEADPQSKSENRNSKIESAFIAPPHTFRGRELWPYTHGMELLFNQVKDREDTGLMVWLSFIFLHLKRTEATATLDRKKHVIPLAWNQAEFRAALVDWLDELGPLTDEVKLEAKRLFDTMRAEALIGAVETPGGRGGGKKKAHSRATRPGSSRSSAKKA